MHYAAALRENPDDLAARWLLNLAQMTLGQYPDQVPASQLIPPEVFLSDYDIKRFGPLLENHPIFPNRANITIAQVTSPTSLEMWTWERGAGLTKACGTGACATAVSAARTGRTGRSVNVTVPGGLLHIEWREDNHVIMTGPAEWEWSGRVDPATGSWEREGEAA